MIGTGYYLGNMAVFGVGAGTPAPLMAYDFTVSSFGGLALPGPLVFQCASGSRTAQSSLTSVITGIGVDTAAIATIDGTNRGLQMEEQGTNLVTSPRDLSPASYIGPAGGTITYNQANGPDGSSLIAAREVNGGTGYGRAQNLVAASGSTTAAVYASAWLKAAGSTSAKFRFDGQSGQDGNGDIALTLTNNWGRYGNLNPGGGLNYFAPLDVSSDAYVDMLQAEIRKFPTSFYIGTRSGTRLYAPSASVVAQGRVRLKAQVVLLASMGGSNDAAAPATLFRYSATDYVQIANNGTVTAGQGGTTRTLATGITGSRATVLDIRLAAGGSQSTIIQIGVNGGARTQWTAGLLGSYSSSGNFDILCDSSATNATDTTPRQLNCLVQSLATYTQDSQVFA